MSIIGIDQSAAGSAMIRLDAVGHVVGQLFYADTAGEAKKHALFGALAPIKVSAGDQGARTYRLAALLDNLMFFLGETGKPSHAALEDYSLARQAFSHTLGEVGGMVRLTFWQQSVPFRVYDVQAVKIFATGAGNATKTQMIDAVREQWGQDWRRYGRRDEGAAGNLADAHTIARMLWTELRVRAGEISLADLPENQRRIFLRCTKQNPINLLDTPFAARQEA